MVDKPPVDVKVAAVVGVVPSAPERAFVESVKVAIEVAIVLATGTGVGVDMDG